jgi:hypothetical protein
MAKVISKKNIKPSAGMGLSLDLHIIQIRIFRRDNHIIFYKVRREVIMWLRQIKKVFTIQEQLKSL